MKKLSLGFFIGIAFLLLPVLPPLNVLSPSTNTVFFFSLILTDLLALYFAFLVISGRKELNLKNRPTVWALVVVLATALLASIFGYDITQSLLGDSAYATGFITLIHAAGLSFLLAELATEADWSLIRRSIFGGAVILAGVSILAHFSSIESILPQWLNASSSSLTLGNETYVGLYLVLSMAIGAVELAHTKSVLGRAAICSGFLVLFLSPVISNLFSIVSGGFSTSANLFGFARSSGLAALVLLASCFLMALSHLPKLQSFGSRIRKGYLIFLTTITVLGSFSLLTPGSFVQEELKNLRLDARFMVWESAKSAVEERPLLGWGPENFDRAFERNFPSGLYEGTRTEIWFDNAHNVFLDILVRFGLLGGVTISILLFFYIKTVLRAERNGKVHTTEAFLLLLVPIIHVIQLQTGFDSISSYLLLGVVCGYVLWLETLLSPPENVTKNRSRCIGASVLILAVISLSYLSFYELPRQLSLLSSLTEKSLSKRLELVNFGLSRTSDFNSLRVGSNLFVESVNHAAKDKGPEPEIYAYAVEALDPYIDAYAAYLRREPEHCYAQMHYAYLLLLRDEWSGSRENNDRAAASLEHCFETSPNIPVPYAVAVIASKISGKSDEANERLAQLGTLAEGTELYLELSKWVEQWPKERFFQLGNI